LYFKKSLILILINSILLGSNNYGNLKKANVFGIRDGDTFYFELIEAHKKGRVEDYEAKLIGVKAPSQTGLGACFVKQARKYLADKILGRIVLVDWGNKKVFDKEQRLMVYVYLESKDIGAEILENGYGWFTQRGYSIDPVHKKEYLKLEREARQKKKGLWGACF